MVLIVVTVTVAITGLSILRVEVVVLLGRAPVGRRCRAEQPLQLRPCPFTAAPEAVEQPCNSIHAECIHIVACVVVRLRAQGTELDDELLALDLVVDSLIGEQVLDFGWLWLVQGLALRTCAVLGRSALVVGWRRLRLPIRALASRRALTIEACGSSGLPSGSSARHASR